jgi:hypothetical protein
MQTPSNLPELIKSAAAWWRQAVSNDAPKDNGDPQTSAMANALLALAGPQEGPQQNQLDRFEAELIIRLTTRLQDSLAQAQEHQQDYFRRVDLATDYGPEGMLALAMTAAGIDHSRAPWKTYTYIDEEGFRVSAGYGAAHVLHTPARYDKG